MEQGREHGKRLAVELYDKPKAIIRLHAEREAGNLVRAGLRDLLPQVWTRESADSTGSRDWDGSVRPALA